MDEDEVSVTSTAVEEFSDSEEFEVDRVLAEKTVRGEKFYLLSWLGYPEDKHTWEPEDHIQNPEILENWDERKRLEARGVAPPFNLQRWESLIKKIAQDKEYRRRLRKAKRKRLGLSVSPDSSDGESIEAVEVDEATEDAPGIEQKKPAFKPSKLFVQNFTQAENYQPPESSSDDDSTTIWEHLEEAKDEAKNEAKKEQHNLSNNAGTARPEVVREPQTKHARARSNSSPDNSLANKRRRESEAQVQTKAQVQTQAQVQAQVTKSYVIPKRSAQSKDSPNVGQQSTITRTGRAGQTATRGGTNLASRRKPRSLLTTSANPKAQPKAFSNMRLKRIAEVRARELAERPPNLEALGGHFAPSKPADLKPLKPSEVRQIRGGDDSDDDAGLFVDQDEPAQSKEPVFGAFISPPYLPASKGPPPDPSHAVCFYYDRGQKDPSKGECSKGNLCPFIHGYPPGVPVATQPDYHIEPSGPRSTCYFWDLSFRLNGTGTCTNGPSCTYLHEYGRDIPIAQKPGKKWDDGLGKETIRSPTFPNHNNDALKTVTQPIQARPTYDESWGFNAICYEWFEGGCANENACPFTHSNKDGIPLGPKSVQAGSAPLSEAEIVRRNRHIPEMTKANAITSFRSADKYYATCFYWDRDGTCRKGPRCNYLHAYRSDAPLTTGPRFKDETCKHWQRGECWKSAEDCDYLHGYTNDESSTIRAQYDDHPSNSMNTSSYKTHRNIEASYRYPDLEVFRHIHDAAPPKLDDDAPIDDSWKIPQTCRFWEKGTCSNGPDNCEYIHDRQENIRPEDFQKARAVIVDGRKKILRPCRVWFREGRCSKSDEECDFLHYHALKDKAVAEKPIFQPGEDLLASLTRSDVRRDDAYNDELMHFYDEPEMIRPAQNPEVVRTAQNRSNGQTRKSVSFGDARAPSYGEPPAPQFAQGEVSDSHTMAQSPTELSNNFQANMALDQMAVPKPKNKMSFEDYRRLSSSNTLANQSKEVTFGNSQSVFVDFCNLSQVQQTWAQELLPLPKIKFDQMCMAHDLEELFAVNKISILWSSNFVLSNPSEAASSTIELVSNEMKLRTSSLASVFPNLIILVYPKTSEWNFLQTSNDNEPSGSRLKFVAFEGDISIRTSKKLGTIPAAGVISDPAPHRKALMKQIHGLEFKKFLPTMNAHSTHNWKHVFLVFPPASDMVEIFTAWLHVSCLDLKIYSSQDEGSWGFFVKNIEAGIILIHESMAAEICRFPHLQDVVKKTTSFWYISDSNTAYPMYPSHYTGGEATRTPGQITATILLPHGQAFFIPPSLVVAEPKKVLEILDWFFAPRGKLEQSNPGTWKLVVCHGFADYVHDIAISKVNEKQEFEQKYRHKPSLDQMLEDKGLDFVTCKLRYSVHQKLVELETRGVLKFSLNGGSMEEQYSPIIYAPPMIDPDNEQQLVEWFASWSLQKLDKHRRFTVIGTGPSSQPRAFRGVDAGMEKVPSLEDQVTRMIADEQNRAARSGLPLINADPNQNLQGLSRRVSFPLAGRTPKSAKSPYSPATPGSGRIPGSPMDLDHAPMSRSNSSTGSEKGEWKEIREPVKTKEVVFEPTSIWYARLKESGAAYEHVFVDRWEAAYQNMGIGSGVPSMKMSAKK